LASGQQILSGSSDGFHRWTDDEFAQVEASGAVKIAVGACASPLQWLGRSDVVRVGPQHSRAGVPIVRQGAKLMIPAHRACRHSRVIILQ
jgi:hypothetical protein